MRLAFLRNPKSGRGKGAAVVDRFLTALKSAGHSVNLIDSGPGTNPGAISDALQVCEVMIVAGGDGTLHHAAPHAAAAGIPIYHVPLGTENLFARQFRMTRDPLALLRALEGMQILGTDMATCNEHQFTLMLSVGFDAAVVGRVAAARTGGITRWTYAPEIWREFRSPCMPNLSVEVDGAEMVREASGTIVISNSPKYAAGLLPSPIASVTDGVLDIVFLPYRSGLGWAACAASIATRGVLGRRLMRRRGKQVVIRTGSPSPIQMDGEAVAPIWSNQELRVQVRPEALKVLVP